MGFKDTIERLCTAVPGLRQISLAKFLRWQAQFLTPIGSRNLAWWLMQGLADELTFRQNGLHWTVPIADCSVSMPLFTGTYFDYIGVGMMTQWAAAHGRLEGRGIIIEIGGNIASTTIPLLQLTHCQIISIEPVPQNLAKLRRNLEQNHFAERVTVVERAISDQGGQVQMIIPAAAIGGSEVDRGNVVRREIYFSHDCETICVETCRLDDLLQNLCVTPDDIAFVWCDIQGSEGAVVRTGAPLWAVGVPLWTEIAPELIRRQENLECFLADTRQHFGAFIPSQQLQREGGAATPRPIADFPRLVAELDATREQCDVLLLPNC